jgi:hypothetical protein
MASLRSPQNLSPRLALETGDGVLGYQIQAEKAESLGRAGRRVEETLTALRRHDFGGGEGEREPLVRAAVQATWGYFVQREACGVTDQGPAIELYGIPGEVLRRLGES